MGNNFLGERQKIDVAMIHNGGSSWNSQCFSLADVGRVSIVCGMHVATMSSDIGMAINPATFTVVVGTYSSGGGSNLAVLAGATLELGHATIGVLTNIQEFCVAAHGTIATGRMIVIDGTTYIGQPNASASDKQWNTSGASAAILSLASRLSSNATHLETFGKVTANNATATSLVYVRRKDYGPGMKDGITVSVTANASSQDQLFITPIRYQGVIEFTPADVLATNTSYTHFAVRFNSAVTLAGATGMNNSVVIIREVGYQATNVHRVQL